MKHENCNQFCPINSPWFVVIDAHYHRHHHHHRWPFCCVHYLSKTRTRLHTVPFATGRRKIGTPRSLLLISPDTLGRTVCWSVRWGVKLKRTPSPLACHRSTALTLWNEQRKGKIPIDSRSVRVHLVWCHSVTDDSSDQWAGARMHLPIVLSSRKIAAKEKR